MQKIYLALAKAFMELRPEVKLPVLMSNFMAVR